MPDTLILGLALVLFAGFFQGSFMAPSKWMRGWDWENYWLIFAITAYLGLPVGAGLADDSAADGDLLRSDRAIAVVLP